MKKFVALLVLGLIVTLAVWPEMRYQYHINVLKLAPVGSDETDRFQREVDQLRRLLNKKNHEFDAVMIRLNSQGSPKDNDSQQTLNRTIASLETDIFQLNIEYESRIRQAPGLFTTDDFDSEFHGPAGVAEID